MRDIYAKATCAIAWLGTASNEIEQLLRMARVTSPILKTSATDHRIEKCGGLERSPEQNVLVETLRLHSSDQSLEEVIGAVCRRLGIFFDEPSFKRIWTLQEAASASQLIMQVGYTQDTLDDVSQMYAVPQFVETDMGDTSAFQAT